jgi:uncharacterized protein
MKRFFSILLFALVVATGHSQSSFDPDNLLKPGSASDHLVTDSSGILTADQRQALEAKLVAFNDSTTSQIAVVIIPTLKGKDVADYTVELFRAWGVGTKKNNNGVLLLISKDDRQLNITTGYGLEGALPDITCKEIIDDVITPKLKDEDFYRAIDEGTDAIMQAVKGEYVAPAGTGSPHHTSLFLRILFWTIGIIVLLILLAKGWLWPILNIASIVFSSVGSGSGGGGFGGFGGGSSGGGGASGSW